MSNQLAGKGSAGLMAGRLADWTLKLGSLICLTAVSFVFYHYHWLHDRQFSGTSAELMYYGVPLVLLGLFGVALYLRPNLRIKVTLCYLTLGFSVYLSEVLLGAYEYIQRNWPAEITGETLPARANVAKRFDINFDRRSRVQVIQDLERNGIAAVPALGAEIPLNGQIVGLLAWNNDPTGRKPFPLGGIANQETVFCNENGPWTIYMSDEHGFHNPHGIWTQNSVDIAAVGDSFTHGACVPSGKNFMALIRKQTPATLNLGVWGMGPISELAVMKEYLPRVKRKIVLWFYFEGNDLDDLAAEEKDPLLMRYYDEEDFSQALPTRQSQIDENLMRLVDVAKADAIREEEYQRTEAWELRINEFLATVKLSALRRRLGMVYDTASKAQGPSQTDPQLLSMFGRILSDAKKMTESWGGTMYFVYLPAWERYSHPKLAPKNKDAVLKLVDSLHICPIDVSTEFERVEDPLALFPFRGFGHYNEAGNEVVAKAVVRVIRGQTPNF